MRHQHSRLAQWQSNEPITHRQQFDSVTGYQSISRVAERPCIGLQIRIMRVRVPSLLPYPEIPLEKQILAAAVNHRSFYDELVKYDIRESLDDQAQEIWDLVTEYYKTDSYADYVDRELLKVQVERVLPKHSDKFCQVIDDLGETSGANLLYEITQQKLESVKLRLAQAFTSDKPKLIEPLLEEYEQLIAGEIQHGDQTEVLIAPDLGSIMESRKEENRIKVLPPNLNAALDGGALRGHHIVVFAPTDMGKTLFTLNMVRGFIEQGHTVLYCGNEDPVSDLIERFLVGLSGKDKFTVRKQWKQAQRFAEKKGWERLVWAELSPGTLGEIRSLVEEHKPDVLIVDQIRNLDTGDKNFVRVLEVAAQGMRNFAKRYDLLSVSVTQAGDSANGKTILTRGDIDNSNVGIPGTADLMLGIGATAEQEAEGVRTLSFPKNKISGNKNPLLVNFNTHNMRVET